MKDLSTLPQIIQGFVLGNLWEAEPNHSVPQTCKTFCGLWRQYGAAKALLTSDSGTTYFFRLWLAEFMKDQAFTTQSASGPPDSPIFHFVAKVQTDSQLSEAPRYLDCGDSLSLYLARLNPPDIESERLQCLWDKVAAVLRGEQLTDASLLLAYAQNSESMAAALVVLLRDSSGLSLLRCDGDCAYNEVNISAHGVAARGLRKAVKQAWKWRAIDLEDAMDKLFQCLSLKTSWSEEWESQMEFDFEADSDDAMESYLEKLWRVREDGESKRGAGRGLSFPDLEFGGRGLAASLVFLDGDPFPSNFSGEASAEPNNADQQTSPAAFRLGYLREFGSFRLESSFWAKESAGYQPLPIPKVPETLALLREETKPDKAVEEVPEEDIATPDLKEIPWSVKALEAQAADFVSGPCSKSCLGNSCWAPRSATTRASAPAGRWEEGAQLLAGLAVLRFQPGAIAFNAAIAGCASQGHWIQALALLASASEEEVADLIGFSSAITACEKASEWQVALSLLEDLEDSARTIRLLWVDLISFNAAISACGNAGCWQQALLLFSSLQQSGLTPDTVSYNALTSAFEKASQWQRALSQLSASSNIVAFGAVVSACARGPEVGIVTCNTALAACKKSNSLQKALQVLDGLGNRRLQPDIITISTLIGACQLREAQAPRIRSFLGTLRPLIVDYCDRLGRDSKGFEKMLEAAKASYAPPQKMAAEPVLIRRSTRKRLAPSAVPRVVQMIPEQVTGLVSAAYNFCRSTAQIRIAMAGRVASATAFALSAGSCLAFVAPKAQD
eukprot:s1145_g5.t2